MCRASGVQKHVLFFCDFLTKTEQEVTEHPLLMWYILGLRGVDEYNQKNSLATGDIYIDFEYRRASEHVLEPQTWMRRDRQKHPSIRRCLF
jgi:hypothetical protein